MDVQRLPPPYSSECGRGTSFFPGQYTVAGCQSTCEIQSMMEKCNGRILQQAHSGEGLAAIYENV